MRGPWTSMVWLKYVFCSNSPLLYQPANGTALRTALPLATLKSSAVGMTVTGPIWNVFWSRKSSS